MNFRTFDLNLLRVFDEVMAERNLTRAARNLAMTQPAASNALRRLRDALGDKLVVRAGYGVEPTPYALSVWPAVRDALGQLRAAVTPEEFDPQTSRASFQLAMADATAALVVPSLLAGVLRDAPGLSLRVQPLTTRDPRPLLESGELDVAVGYFPGVTAALALTTMQADAPDVVGIERLYSGRYVCVMRKDHPLAAQPLTLDAYCEAKHLLVSFSGRPFGFVDEVLAAIHRSRRIVLTVNQFFTAGLVVAGSDLLTVLPTHFIASTGLGDDIVVRELPLEMAPVHVDMLWHRRQENRAAHGWLRERIVQAARSGFEHSAR
ncbi:MAG: LysR family transcriptional regulator [Burkholderiaceae bacterium]|nr:LysR family transcriptional regulator [Burkholderiaceae bacterium]